MINENPKNSSDKSNATSKRKTKPSPTVIALEIAKHFNGKFTVTNTEDTAEGVTLTMTGNLELTQCNPSENDDLSWKELAILRGAVRCDMYLSPLEYAVIQILKEKFFTYYATKQLHQSAPGNAKPSPNLFSEDCAELIAQLSTELLGDPEDIQVRIKKGAAKNKKARDKVAQKSKSSEPVAYAESANVHPLVLAIAKILESYVARKERLSDHIANYIRENERLKKKLGEVTQQRDHFMRCLETGPDFMNYAESNRFLQKQVIELQRKVKEQSETRH